VFWRQGRHEAAERAWQQALSLVPTHAPTHRALGLLYARRGEFAKALHHLERARDLDPLAWRSHFDLAAFYFRFGFVDEAVTDCEVGLRLHPERRELRLLLADLMMETRNWARAVELYGEPPRQNSAGR
jgi:tetratricopeptide (TPR) repeat protein